MHTVYLMNFSLSVLNLINTHIKLTHTHTHILHTASPVIFGWSLTGATPHQQDDVVVYMLVLMEDKGRIGAYLDVASSA